jgi:hypothetical protein
MKKYFFLVPLMFISNYLSGQEVAGYSFSITLPLELSKKVEEGRLLLLISTNEESEPRFQINDGPNTQMIFGMDVPQIEPGKPMVFDSKVFGYPLEELNNVPEGKYRVQVLLNRYEKFNLESGHTVSLPPEMGEGQQWNRKPGNYYSTPVWVDLKKGKSYDLKMDSTIPPIEPPKDSKYIKHVKMKSELLSQFWGRDIYLGANVLIPENFDQDYNARYPIMIFHGHFPYTIGGFRETPPDPNLEPEYSARFGVEGYNRFVQQEAYDFYKKWTSDTFPRFLVVEIQHANPYYDDSYAVNSANLGPYGDAITYELIPFLEEKFRGVGQSWGRFLYGGSTGGWEALAAQVFYPDEYNGCFAACPDPIDFAAYCLVNLYKYKNAYYYESNHKEVLIPGRRDYLGNVSTSVKDMNHKELALGTKTRSGQQFDIWEAVYSPMGPDGYPMRIWDKYSGKINTEVAEYWKENYDLRHILQRDWKTLGPKLEGKIHIYCGDMDNYYLNNAVYLMEDFLSTTKNPFYNGEITYGDRAEHCWNGDPNLPNHVTRLRYNTMYISKIKHRIKETATKDSGLVNWD